MTAKTAAAGHTAKHVTKSKASKSTKKHSPTKTKKPVSGAKSTPVHAAAKPAKPAKARAFAIGDVLPVCAFEALAAALRLAGGAVSDEDVAELSWLAGGGEIAPASILAALEAASVFGLAGYRPVGGRTGFEPATAASPVPGRAFTHAAPSDGPLSTEVPAPFLILGIHTPGPHAVLATADGWWSWGELYAPWPARVEEAWLIGWTDEKSARRLSPLVRLPGAESGQCGWPVHSLAGDAP